MMKALTSCTPQDWAAMFIKNYLVDGAKFQEAFARELEGAVNMNARDCRTSIRAGSFVVPYNWVSSVLKSDVYEIRSMSIENFTKELLKAIKVLLGSLLGEQSPSGSYFVEFLEEPFRVRVKYELDFARAQGLEPRLIQTEKDLAALERAPGF